MTALRATKFALATFAALGFGTASAQAIEITETVTMNLLTDGTIANAGANQKRYTSAANALNFGITPLSDGDVLTVDILFSEGDAHELTLIDFGDGPIERFNWIRFHAPGNDSLGTTGDTIGSVEVELLNVTGTIDNLDSSNPCVIPSNDDRCQAPDSGNWGDLTDSVLSFGGLRVIFTADVDQTIELNRVQFRLRADNIQIPEPATLGLLGLGLVGLGALRRRRA